MPKKKKKKEKSPAVDNVSPFHTRIFSRLGGLLMTALVLWRRFSKNKIEINAQMRSESKAQIRSIGVTRQQEPHARLPSFICGSFDPSHLSQSFPCVSSVPSLMHVSKPFRRYFPPPVVSGPSLWADRVCLSNFLAQTNVYSLQL